MSSLSDARRNLLEKSLRGQVSLKSVQPSIPRRDASQPIPLSYSQEQVWMHAQLVPEIPLYNEPVTIHYSGELDVPALEASFNEILRRHEAWRTCFKIVDGKPVQDVKGELSVSIPVVDLRQIPEDQRDSAATSIATLEAATPLDLAQAPLFRVRLIRLAEREYRLYLVLSHIIFDGVAIYRVFLPELAALYRARVENRPSPLKELEIQYPDYSSWQRKTLTTEALARHTAYWRRQLGPDLPTLNLPTDRPRPSVQTFRGSMYPFVLNSTLTDGVRALARQEGVSLFQTLLAGFAALLARYCDQDDLPIGSVTAGRDWPQTQALLGYFLNTVVLRVDASGDPSFRELLRRVRNVTLETLDHDSVPFTQLLHELNASRDLSRNPLFQVMFSLEPALPEVDSAWRLTQMDVDTGASKYDLYLELDERRSNVLARFHFNTDLFDHATIIRMSEHWMRLLAGAALDSGARISDLPLLSEEERNQVVEDWNKASATFPSHSTIQEVFDAQCERTPDSIAIIEKSKHVNFRQLQERSDRLARRLQKLGAGPGSRVALCVERSVDMFVGLMGILKSGAAYVPLDPTYPFSRLRLMLEDSDPIVVLGTQRLLRGLPTHGAQQLALEAESAESDREGADVLEAQFHSNDPRAYVLYTSGSSGKPKGVEGTHAGALNRMQWMWERYPFAAGEVCCQKTNLGFVDSVWEIFGPLLAGVPSVIVPQETLLDPEELIRYLAQYHVTRLVLVPTLLRALLDHAPDLGERLPELKLWTCSGEALPWELAARFQKACPQATLLNIYGSSEVSADVTWHEVRERAEGKTGTVPIGKPISNTQVYVLDRKMNPVPVGVQGEIYVGGAGLALGYWKQPELTAEKFVENRIAPERSKRLYKTGDLGRWQRNGELEYLGRIDSEVKVRGMRLDLREIETVLGAREEIEEAVVELASDNGDEARLLAYLVTKEGKDVSAGELRRYLRTKLPEHMVPSSYVRVEKVPQLPSGKVNRRALRELSGVALAEQGIVRPETEIERKLAQIWEELLKRKEVGVDQNFFELGGHSLLVLQVMARIRRMFEVELAVRTMFEEPTIAGLAKEVEKAQALGLKAKMPVLERRQRPEATATASREALLAQLDTLSPDDVQSLLKRVLDAKHSIYKN